MPYRRCALSLLLVMTMLTGCSEFYSGEKTVRLKGENVSRIIEPEGELTAETYTINIDNLLIDERKASHISIAQSDEPYVIVDYCPELDEYGFEVEILDGEINITTDYDCIYAADNFHIEIYANYDTLNLNGGYDVLIDGSGVDELTINAGEYVDCWLDYMNLDLLNMNLTGNGNLYMYSGRAFKIEANISGSYEIDARRLLTRYCTLDISGYCDSDWSVQDILRLDYSGWGELGYYGSPKIWQEVAGAQVEQVDEDTFV